MVTTEPEAVIAAALAGAAAGGVATFPFPAIGGVFGALAATLAGALLGAAVGLRLSRSRRSHEERPSSQA